MRQFILLHLLIILFLFPVFLFAQRPLWDYDSVFNSISTTQSASLRCQSYSIYSLKYQRSNPDTVVFYLQKAFKYLNQSNEQGKIYYYYSKSSQKWQKREMDSSLYYGRIVKQLSEKINYAQGKIFAASQIGLIYKVTNEYDSAIHYLSYVIDNANQTGMPWLGNKAHYDISGVYNMMGKQHIALEHQLTALKMQENANDSVRLLFSYLGLGNTYQFLDKPIKSRDYYLKALQFDSVVKEFDLRGTTLVNMGLIYEKGFKNYDSALYYYKLSNDLFPENDRSQTRATIFVNSGNTYFALKKFDLALAYYNEAMKFNLKKTNSYMYSALLINKGIVLANKFEYDSAFAYLNEGLTIATEIDAKIWQMNAYQALYEAEIAMKNYKGAVDYLTSMISLKDSISNEANLNHVSELEIIYESQKKDALNRNLLNEQRLARRTIENQRKIIFWSIAATILFVLLVISIFRSSRKQKINNLRLQSINDEISAKNQLIDEQNKLLLEQTEIMTNAIQTKDKLFSVISHDLRGPFNLLQGFLDLLNMEYTSLSDEEKKEMLRMIKSSSQNALNLLVNLLEWARTQRGMLKNNAEILEVDKIADAIVTTMQARAETKNQLITTNMDHGIYVVADPNLLSSVIQNLLGNALKFSKRGSTIQLNCSVEPHEVIISVTDQGIGIAEADLNDLFTIGNNAKRSGTENEPGTGLGLILVAEFVQLMGGKIKATSDVGKGSTFTFTLPRFTHEQNQHS